MYVIVLGVNMWNNLEMCVKIINSCNMSGNLSIESFNCHGFNGCKPFLCDILCKCDILCLQELMISKQDCHMLNSCHRAYLGYGVSPVDASLGVLSGRPYGGVGFFVETCNRRIRYDN